MAEHFKPQGQKEKPFLKSSVDADLSKSTQSYQKLFSYNIKIRNHDFRRKHILIIILNFI